MYAMHASVVSIPRYLSRYDMKTAMGDMYQGLYPKWHCISGVYHVSQVYPMYPDSI